MAVRAISWRLLLTWFALGACEPGSRTSVAIGVLNLAEGPRRLVKVCLDDRCTSVNTVLEHGDEAVVAVAPSEGAAVAFTVEERGGTRVLPCPIRMRAGVTGSLQVGLTGDGTKVLANNLHAAPGTP